MKFVQAGLKAGWLARPANVDAGWGGEALGLGKAAMVIEGNWIRGAMSNGYPDVTYTVVDLPAGPGGQGPLQFTVCWGVAAQSFPDEQAAAVNMTRAMDPGGVPPDGAGREAPHRDHVVAPESSEDRNRMASWASSSPSISMAHICGVVEFPDAISFIHSLKQAGVCRWP